MQCTGQAMRRSGRNAMGQGEQLCNKFVEFLEARSQDAQTWLSGWSRRRPSQPAKAELLVQAGSCCVASRDVG